MPHQDSQKRHFRSIFLSDFHIGAKTFNAPALLDFLRKTESETLYLVGDIIDGWKLHKRWYWTESVSEVFDELFRKAHEGTKIIYIMGNHDERVREISFLKRFRYSQKLKIQIKNRIVHKLADGRDFLILHGDQFDRALLRGRLSRWSDRLYDLLSHYFNKHNNPTIRIDGVEKRFSLAKFLGYHGQIALNILNNFENAVAKEARRSDVQGIICGHTHISALKNIRTITYANCGSWLKNSQSAVVESMRGQIELMEWNYDAQKDETPVLPFFIGDIKETMTEHKARKFRPMTEQLKSAIRRTWPAPQDITASQKTSQTKQQERLCTQ